MTLPKPPEGHRWHITPGMIDGYLQLRLQKKSWLGHWRTVAREGILADYPKGAYQESIFRRQALEKAHKILRGRSPHRHNDAIVLPWAEKLLSES